MDLGRSNEEFEVAGHADFIRVATPAPLASADFLTNALRQAQVGTWQVEMLSGIATWDAVTSSIIGLPEASMAGGGLLPVHPDDRGRVSEWLQARVDDAGSADIDFRITRPTQEVRWVRAIGHPLAVPHASGPFVAGILKDITERRDAAECLRAAEERYRLISQVSADLIFDWDVTNDRLTWNETWGPFFGYTSEQLGSMTALSLKIHPDDYGRVELEIARAFETGGSKYTSDHRFLGSDGSYYDVHSCGYIVRDQGGCPVRMIGSIQDVTDRRYADAALRESEAINRGIVEASPDSIVLLDLEGKLLFVNHTGSSSVKFDDITNQFGRPWTSLWPTSVRPEIEAAVKTAARGDTAQFTEAFARADGLRWWDVIVSPIRDDDGVPIKLVAIARDITHRREADEQLRRAATLDSLTGLPNRACFQEKLSEAVSRAGDEGTRLGLLLLDVDDFKQVNDSLGHDAGDVLLKSFASRLELPAGRNCLVARLGGDEFAVLLENINDAAELTAHAEKILKRMQKPLVYAGGVLDCHATIGAALVPEHGSTPEELLKCADIALYVAKTSARGGLTIFEPKHRDNMQERAAMVALARTALRNDRLVPFYQPKVTLSDHTIHGFEALLRWQHPTRGFQLPATITAAFEDLEVATAISQRMIDRVIEDMRNWLDQGIGFGHVAVNAAAAEFRSDGFAESVLERLQRAGVSACHFQLEVTETVFLGKGAEYVDRALKLLDREGVRIALDDFGTGYASLRHLKQFPVHVMKIDQGFVQGMAANPEDAAIIAAVLNLGKSLDIEVVAEGIETGEQAARLRSLGCNYGQGFLYSKAVPADRVPNLLTKFAQSEAA